MNMKKIKILSWNVRGLGADEKCNLVKSTIRTSRCDVCCLQETKWNTFDLLNYSKVLSTFFERNCVALKAINSSGGCIIAWKKSYNLILAWASYNTCSAVLLQVSTSSVLRSPMYTGQVRMNRRGLSLMS